FEGFGISLIEAMASGKPLIFSDIDPFKEVLGLYDLKFLNGFSITKFGVMFEAGNSVALANAIKWMMNNQEKWSEFGKNSYQRAKDFDISKTVQEYERIYKEILNL
ncbi:MAG: glycosyltransferase, partial [Athalassotoga sp.]